MVTGYGKDKWLGMVVGRDLDVVVGGYD